MVDLWQTSVTHYQFQWGQEGGFAQKERSAVILRKASNTIALIGRRQGKNNS